MSQLNSQVHAMLSYLAHINAAVASHWRCNRKLPSVIGCFSALKCIADTANANIRSTQ